MGIEPEVELEMIKESQWEMENKEEHSLLNSYIK
jgi:post-segregation antitoxin (ccd killing protein)